MRIHPRTVVLGGAAVLLIAGLVENSADLLLASLIAGVAGLGTGLFSWWGVAPFRLTRRRSRIRQLEQRLDLAEEELALATRELADLRDQHDFDLQLHRLQRQRVGLTDVRTPNP